MFLPRLLSPISRLAWFRGLPRLPADGPAPKRPISFVVVRFSQEADHNILESPAVCAAGNQLVLVDNTGNVHHRSLAKALNTGLESARHELVALVHEDVYLPVGWHRRFDEVLDALESEDPDWGIVGSIGVDEDGAVVGHARNPFGYRNTFGRGELFSEVRGLDEQLFVFHRGSGWRLDEALPGIHGLATDLVLTAAQAGRRTYVVDAPLIHKYRGPTGRRIRRPTDSAKIRDRASRTHQADRAACEEYLRRKWRRYTPFQSPSSAYPDWEDPREELVELAAELGGVLDQPVVLLAKGGGGSRLLSSLAQDCGLYRGTAVNSSGDSEEMVEAIYRAVIGKLAAAESFDAGLAAAHIRLAGARMLLAAPGTSRASWGFKLPESLLVLPEIATAFPRARYVHFLRHPLNTTLRRSHMTARLDNAIGRLTLPAAYIAAGVPTAQILDDPAELHMAYTTRHQLLSAWRFTDRLAPADLLELAFEETLASADRVLSRMASWLDCGTPREPPRIQREIDSGRGRPRWDRYEPALVQAAKDVLAPAIARFEANFGRDSDGEVIA